VAAGEHHQRWTARCGRLGVVVVLRLRFFDVVWAVRRTECGEGENLAGLVRNLGPKKQKKNKRRELVSVDM